jgi:hypothetical protein
LDLAQGFSNSLDSAQGFSNSLDSAQGFSNSWILPKGFLVIFSGHFVLVILDGHLGGSFLLVILVIENCILTQILVRLHWRYYQQLIVGIILLIVTII